MADEQPGNPPAVEENPGPAEVETPAEVEMVETNAPTENVSPASAPEGVQKEGIIEDVTIPVVESSPLDSAPKEPAGINEDFQYSISEHEAHKCFGGVYAAWSQKKLAVEKGDSVKFSWLVKGRRLTISGKKIDDIVYDDTDNKRSYIYTFDTYGTYKITCSDENTSFTIKISVVSPDKLLRMTIMRTVLQFGILGAILIGGSYFGTAALLDMQGLGPKTTLDGDTATATEKNMKNLQDIAYKHSRTPVVLAVIMIVVAPLMGLYNFIRPRPLSSYGRGYEYTTHVNVRCVVVINAVVVFVVVMMAWNSYGRNGNAMENVMNEVSDLAVYCAEQLGRASGSLGNALSLIVVLPGQNSCTGSADKTNQELCEGDGGTWNWGDPEELYGDVMECPGSDDPDNSPEFAFCALQVELLKKLSDQLVGEEASFKDDPATTDLLQSLGKESVNSAAYASLGEQAISSIMRVRMILIYFVMQISLISAALCAAGGFRSKQKLIKSGGWCALLALIIVLFSYSVNIINATLVDQAVTNLKKANAGEGDGDSPMVQLLAYCKPQEEGACDSTIDLSFALNLTSSVLGTPNKRDCVSPSEIQGQITLASSQMSAAQMTIFGDPKISKAVGEGTRLLTIVGNIFSAVGNIIDIIDCKVAYESFQRMLVILDLEANQTFKDIASAELTLAVVLGVLFCVARFTAYVLDRPKKLYCCLETGRWFRFKAAYKAHVSLLKKKKKFGVGKLLKYVPIPRFSFMSIAMEIAMVFHIGLFLLIPNAFMALSEGGFRGVPSEVPYTLLATSFIGLTTTWSMSRSWISFFGCVIAVLVALGSAFLCVKAAADEVIATNECFQLMQEANEAAAAEAAAECDDDEEDCGGSNSVMAVQGVTGSDGMSCDFATITDSVQSTIFCLVCMLLCLLTTLAGLCFLCARNHLMTDKVRKTMLKMSVAGTKDGAKNRMIESMGGERTDGLGGSGFHRIQVKFKRLKANRWFQLFFIVACAGGAAGTGMVFKQIQDDIMESKSTEWEFNQCTQDQRNTLGECCNGLNENCDREVVDVMFAGVHNSMSSAEDNWLAPNNFYNEIGALDAGYRGLMIDLHMHNVDGEDCHTPANEEDNDDNFVYVSDNCELYSCHGLCMFGKTRTLEEFRNITNWLNEKRNEQEVLLIFFENENRYGMTQAMYADMEELGMNDMLVERNSDGKWPTMRDAIKANKRIIILNMANCNNNDGNEWCPKGYHPAFPSYELYLNADGEKVLDYAGNSFDSNYHINASSYFKAERDYSCDILDRGTFADDNFFVLNHFVTNPVASPSFAHEVNWNPFLEERVKKCEEAVGQRANFVAIDFWSIGDTVKLAQTMNKEPLPAAKDEDEVSFMPAP